MRTLLSILLAATASAQIAPTQGMRLLAPSVVGDDDPTAVETNPAALGFARSGLVLAFDEMDGAGDAIGVFGNLRLGSLSSALSYQSLDRNGKLSTGLALGRGRVLGVGVGLHWYNSDEDRAVDDEFSVDLGATLRPFSLVALGLVVRNVNTPRFEPDLLERVYDLELGIRPIGSDRLELAGGLRIGEDSEDIDPHFRASLSFWGAELRGDLEIDEAPGVPGDDVRATVGLALHLEHVGAFGGAILHQAPQGSPSAVGAIAGLRVSSQRYRPLPVEPDVIEEIVLDGPIAERDIVLLQAHLAALQGDDRTAGVLLRIGDLGVGWATIEELRDRIARLRKAGKAVYAHLEGASVRAYLLATAAQRVLVSPAGGVRLVGLHASLYFYKGTLDLLGVRADIIKIAEYKSAPEVVTETKSTAPAREVREAILDDLYGRLLRTLATARGTDAAGMSGRIDHGPYTASESLRAGLVDEVVAPEDLREWLERRHGDAVLIPAGQVGSRRASRWGHAPRIAVVVVEGDLVDGESQPWVFGEQMAGGDTIARAIERARESSAVAIVVRVNSPGGMVGAADRIWREIYKTRGKKPIVASLGDVAASGGYYLASAADQIVASPSTITGSIGIFFGKVDISGLLAKLGITHESYSRGARASIDSELRPYTDEERTLLMGKMRQFYDRFREVVSKGRGVSMEHVDKVGRGHVWTGAQALGHKLVDGLGGLEEAIALAKRRAGLAPDAPVEFWVTPEPPSDVAQRIVRALVGAEPQGSGLFGTTIAGAIGRRLRGIVPPSLIEARGQALARLDYDIRWE